MRSFLQAISAAAGIAVIAGVPACGTAPAKPSDPPAAGKGGGALAPQTRAPATAVSVLTDSAPQSLTAAVAKSLFTTSPVVVVSALSAAPESGKSSAPRTPPRADHTGQAVQAAGQAHAPLLLAPPNASPARLAGEIRSLHPKAVLVLGLPARGLQAKLRAVRVVTAAKQLPATGGPPKPARVAILVPKSSHGPSQAIAAITVTARAAGAAVVPVAGGDPRTDPSAIRALARIRPEAVVGIGKQFGAGVRLKNRLAVAETGVQLPGGGEVMFPGRRLVALYGHPGAASLGALGQQGLSASVRRAQRAAGPYRKLSKVPVVPTFEIIATVAEGSPGASGQYTAVTPASELRPWVDRATSRGMYVVLDLQPGRANLLDQARHYESLLSQPNVGLALDPEWKLQPGQKPLRQIGHVGVGEVNSVVHWLAALTARHHLPQKLLVIHQFRASMISGEKYLDRGSDDLSIVLHMDGQGSQGAKQSTWNSVTGGAPGGVWFGWKDFFVKDHPMLTPRETMAKTPTPVMISYQ